MFDESMYFNELNNDFVKKLNTAFGYEFKEAEKSYGKGLDCREANSTAEHLDKFIDIDELDMREEMRAAGASDEEARKYSGFLAGAKTRQDVSRVIEHMVQDCGLWATGAVLVSRGMKSIRRSSRRVLDEWMVTLNHWKALPKTQWRIQDDGEPQGSRDSIQGCRSKAKKILSSCESALWITRSSLMVTGMHGRKRKSWGIDG